MAHVVRHARKEADLDLPAVGEGTGAHGRHFAHRVREELADVLILSMCMANTLNIDVGEAYREKMEANARKYPADQARGRSDKYTRYSGSPAGDR